MACKWVKLPDGGFAHLKLAGGRRPKPCSVCGGPGGRLCDFPLGGGKTCDASLCSKCAVPIAPNVEFCPHHPKRPSL